MKSIKTILLLLGLSPFLNPSFGQVGVLDSSFHSDGAAFFHFIGGSVSASSLIVLPNEKILVAGTVATGPGSDSDILLLRYNPDGSLDASFGDDGMSLFSWGGQDDFAKAMAVQSDGRILVAGWTVSNDKAYGILCRFTEDGTLDSSFDEDGVIYNGNELVQPPSMDVFVASADRILWCLVTKQHDTSITRLLANGEVDTAFGKDGEAFLALPGGMSKYGAWTILPDGRIVAIVVFIEINDMIGSPNYIWVSFARFSEDGTQKIVQNSNADEIFFKDAIAWEDGVVTTGNTVSKLDYDGKVDINFAFKGAQHVLPGIAYSIAPQVDGKLVAVGQDNDTLDASSFIIRLKEDGELDEEFGDNGHVLLNFSPNADIAYATAIDADDRILVGGKSGDSLMVARLWGSKYTGPPDPGVDSLFFGFRPNPVGEVLIADYGLPADGTITIDLMDIFGRQVQSFYVEATRQAGHYVEPLHFADALSNGTYFLRFRSGGLHSLQKLIIVR